MSDPYRVSYVDHENFGGGAPAKFSIVLVRQPVGDGYYPQPDTSDLPADALDALRAWLVGGPTRLRPDESQVPEQVQPKCSAGNELRLHTNPCSPGCNYPENDYTGSEVPD